MKRILIPLVMAALLASACGRTAPATQNQSVPEPPSGTAEPAATAAVVEDAPPAPENEAANPDATAPAPENEAANPVDASPDAPAGDAEDARRINPDGPLSEEQAKILDEIAWDVDPEILNAVESKNEGGHFPYSDEYHLDLFKEHIENLGGTYIGVGTDQGYLFIGWQRPSLAFVVDYDPWVVIIHRLYMAFWKQCDTRECLHRYFADRALGMEFMKSDDGKAAGLDTKLAHEVFKKTQGGIARQLKRVERMKVKSFMNDDETFLYIKTMIEQGRIRTLQANLLGDRAFKSIADAMNELGAKVMTLYLSNAEQYWGYSEQFKKNVIGMPSADNALILRTSAVKPINGDYRYSIQPVSVFKAWLQHPDGKSVRQVTRRVKPKDAEDFPFVIDDFLPPGAE